MNLREINTLEELQAERKRLALEAETAKSYLTLKSSQTIDHGKSLVAGKLSWPAVLGSFAAYGGSKLLLQHNRESTSSTNPNWVTGIRQGLELIETRDPQKLLEVLPTIMNLLRPHPDAPK